MVGCTLTNSGVLRLWCCGGVVSCFGQGMKGPLGFERETDFGWRLKLADCVRLKMLEGLWKC